MDEVMVKVMRIVLESAGDRVSLKPDTVLKDLDLDSLDEVELSQDLEEEFDIRFGSDGDVNGELTVRELVEIVREKINNK